MGFRTSKPDFKPVSEGECFACLVKLVDLGRGRRYEKDEVCMQFELHALPGEASFDDDGRGAPPRVWMMPMSLSMYWQSKLCALVAGWDGVDVQDVSENQDLEERLGRWARAEITHNERNGRTYAHINALMPLQDGDGAHLPSMTYNKPGAYDVRTGRNAEFDSLPGWLQEKVMDSLDWPPTVKKREEQAVHEAAQGTPASKPARRGKRELPEAAHEAATRFEGLDSLDDVPF